MNLSTFFVCGESASQFKIKPIDTSPPITAKPVPFVTIASLIWCTVVFVALYSGSELPVEELHRYGFYSADEIFNGAWWALITTAFIHVEVYHFFFNMYWLYQLGPVLERHIGSSRFLAFVLGSAFVSSSLEAMAGHSGIGFSGVGYAIAGFGWIAAKYRPEMSAAFSHKTITMFVGWGILCLALTMLGLLTVGNIAHGSGFAFGALIALGSYKKSLPARIAATLVLLVSAIHLNWNPMSSHWNHAKAGQAMNREDYDRAVPLFKRSLELGYDPELVWRPLAEIYGYQRNLPAYTEALDALKKINPTAADEVIKVYGLPSGRLVE